MSQRRRFSIACLLVLAASALPGRSASADDAPLSTLEERAFKQAAALVGPSIVRIETVGGLDQVGRVLTGTGPTSGLVVSEDGYILSSSFNFASKPASILVQLADGRRFPAKLVATDHLKMLTLLKIDAQDLTPARPAKKAEMKVGQWALALGRTYDIGTPSVSVGIISALGRIWGKAIQTDAKVSPVNYGGPLVDVEGQVLGVLVPLSPKGGGETAGVEWYDSGIGFAIPLEDVLAVLDRLKKGEDLRRGLLGVNLRGGGLLAGEAVIDRVRVGSPAKKAGFRKDDVIVEIEGRPVHRQAEARQVLGGKYAGETVRVTVRRGEERITKEITLAGELVAYESGFLGILPMREQAAPASDEPGVGVRYVYADSPAAKAGLEFRDRIIRFADQEVTDAASLTELVGRLRPGEKASLVYRRGDAETTVEVELAAIPASVPKELRSSPIPPVTAPEEKPDEKPRPGGQASGGRQPPVSPDEEPAGSRRPLAEARTGRFTDTLPSDEHTFWAYVPEGYNPAWAYGLMVWVHPDGDTMEAAVYKQWKSICDRRGIILLAPKAAKISGFTPNEAEFVEAAVQEFQKRYTIDPARVFVHGYAEGGSFAFRLAFKFRELFHGVAVASAPLPAQPPENDPEHRLQFHLVCGSKDARFPLVARSAALLGKMKFPVSFTTVKGGDEKYPAEEQVREIGRWADCLDRI